jgi:hypothetical protein
MYNNVAQSNVRFDERPRKQAALVAMEARHGIAYELVDVRRPPRRVRDPRGEQLSGASLSHLFANADVDKKLRQQLAIDDGRKRSMAHRQAESLNMFERELLYVRRIGADYSDAQHDFEHVVYRERVNALIARATQ